MSRTGEVLSCNSVLHAYEDTSINLVDRFIKFAKKLLFQYFSINMYFLVLKFCSRLFLFQDEQGELVGPEQLLRFSQKMTSLTSKGARTNLFSLGLQAQ